MRARTPESDAGRPSLSVSFSSFAAAADVAAAMSARAWSARGQGVVQGSRGSSECIRSSNSLSSERERHGQGTRVQSVLSFGSQGSRPRQQQREGETPPSPSILSQSVRSEDTTSVSTTTRTVTLGQATSEAPLYTCSGFVCRSHLPH